MFVCLMLMYDILFLIFLQGVFEIDKEKGMVLTEIGEGFTVEDVQAATGCKLIISENLINMRLS